MGAQLKLVDTTVKKSPGRPLNSTRAFKKPARVRKNSELNALWNEVIPLLEDAELAKPVDALFLEMMLRHFLIATRASDELMADESVAQYDEKNGRMARNPCELIQRTQSSQFLAYAKEAGITFRSRGGVDKGKVEAENPFMPKTGS